jgi:hypothetical protein
VKSPLRRRSSAQPDALARSPFSPPSQKRCPTAFHLFPNAREVALTLSDKELFLANTIRRVDVLRLVRLPSAPADKAAARAALAGVTRLEVHGVFNERAQLEAALRHLPGLREVALMGCGSAIEHPDEADELSEALVAALAWRPSIESLEWEVYGWLRMGLAGEGAQGHRGLMRNPPAPPGGRRSDGRGLGSTANAELLHALTPRAMCRSNRFGGAHVRACSVPGSCCPTPNTACPQPRISSCPPPNPQVCSSLSRRRLGAWPPRFRR